ncbi:hypothetical protein QFC21_004108 [Naganishia friedmannii]|uniref:Uncharacterized protein n=1 Tax=Naganishia friedmannii TaxID=89922 RepID=A0ACC2VJH7_9TREE|nr:hypothetical protein QFC21_004108 [Naganishia friedmannii]
MSATEFSLRRRPSKPSEDIPPVPLQGKSSGHTITYEESLKEVPWQTDNRYIRKGYRRRLRDVKSVLFSLIGCIDLALKHLPAWTPTAFHIGETISSKSSNISAIQGNDLLTPRPQTLIGIVILIVGSFWPSLYYGFREDPVLQVGYIALVTSFGIAQIWHRTLTFIALGLSAVLPIGHLVIQKGWDWAMREGGLGGLAAGGACYIFGAVL